MAILGSYAYNKAIGSGTQATGPLIGKGPRDTDRSIQDNSVKDRSISQ